MAMDVSPVKEEGNDFKVSEEKLMTCASNSVGNALEMEEAQSTKHTKAPTQEEDLEINIITDCTNSGEEEVVERAYQEATESSSSFGDTDPGIASTAPSVDVEVESICQEEVPSMLSFDGLSDIFQIRKKKVTTHWRKFIHPLMWRCKWVELQIKELQRQALKYDEELAKCEERKRLELQGLTAEDRDVKCASTRCQNQSINVMRRKRRKRVEEKSDIESYMSQHNLFSYYVNRRSIADDGYIDEDRPAVGSMAANKTARNDEFCANEDWVPLEFKHGDSFEEMLQKIGDVQAQLQLLRARMNKVISENTVNFLSDNLSLLAPCHAQTGSAARLELPFMSGDANARACSAMLFPNSEHKATEQVLHESAVSSYGEVAPLPDMIEDIDQPLTGISCEKIEDPSQVFNESMKQELHSFEGSGLRLVPGKKPQSSNDQEEATLDPLMNVKHEFPSDTVVATKQPTLKSRSISKSGTPKSKRKRGRRKPASNRWT